MCFVVLIFHVPRALYSCFKYFMVSKLKSFLINFFLCLFNEHNWYVFLIKCLFDMINFANLILKKKKKKNANLFYYSVYFCYYLWVLSHFLVLFISLTILFQLTFTFIYNIFNKKFTVSTK